MKVLKRSGKSEDLNVDKIKNVVGWASSGYSVNPLELESKITSVFKNGINTKQIQENLIHNALALTSVEDPDWRYVAGRLLIMDYIKNVKVSLGYDPYKNLYKDIVNKVKQGIYDVRILNEYTEEEINEVQSWIQPNRDLDYDYAGANMLVRRYFVNNELPQQAFMMCSLLLPGLHNYDRNSRLKQARRYYEAISQRKNSLATPLLSNLRKPDGNLSSCFITAMNDSLDSIFGDCGITGLAKISKNGGGVGVYLGKIRAAGAYVQNIKGASGGVVPWIKILNDTALAVNQLGKRAGACTVALDSWHLDIEDLLELQTENGDLRRKAYDIFPQMVVTDEFMRRVEDKQEWTLMDPHEVRTRYGIELSDLWGSKFTETYKWLENQQLELRKTVNARELFKKAIKVIVEKGKPYITFKCTINKANPCPHVGVIYCVNLCTESFSPFVADELVHCCNLVSPNLANLTDLEEVKDMVMLSVDILDDAIDITTTPIAQAKAHNDLLRTIGIGAMGFADWLAKKQIHYSQAQDEADALFEEVAYAAFKRSNELAKTRGAYAAFEGSEHQKGILMGRDVEWFKINSRNPQRWVDLIDSIKEYGLRNALLMAIAPNTSSSLIQGCTASVLPSYSKFYYDKNGSAMVPIAPPFIKDKFWFYPENRNLNQSDVASVIANIQKWIDTGISYEPLFNFNQPGVNAKTIYDLFMQAWKSEIKTIYYTRSIVKSVENNNDNDCISCAN